MHRRPSSSSSAWRTIVAPVVVAGGTISVCSLPVFLVGALAVEMTEQLGFGLTGLGIAVGTFSFSAAAAAVHGGRLVDRWGTVRSVRTALGLACLASLGIAGTAQGVVGLAFWLMVGGVAVTVAQSASNRLLIGVARPAHMGFAFGVGQAATPVATMLAGLVAPSVALTLGWRWAYVGLTVPASAIGWAVARLNTRPVKAVSGTSRRTRLSSQSTIITLAVAMGLSWAAVSSLLTFFVEAAVRGGAPQRAAGATLAAASLGAVVVRLTSGAVADRMTSGHLQLAASLVAVGSIGYSLLAIGHTWAMTVGSIVALSGVWGCTGLFWFATVRAYRDTPGRISGALAPSVLGGVAGPILFGWIVDGYGYSSAWLGAMLLAAASSVMMNVGGRRLDRIQPSA